MKFIMTSSKKDEAEKLKAKLSIMKSDCTITYIENGWYFSHEDGTLISYDKTINIREEIMSLTGEILDLSGSELEGFEIQIDYYDTEKMKNIHTRKYNKSYRTNSVFVKLGIYGVADTFMKMDFIFEPFTGTFIPCISNSIDITDYNDTDYMGYGYLSSTAYIGNYKMVKVLIDLYKIACIIKEKGISYVANSMKNDANYITKFTESTVLKYIILKYKEEAIDDKEYLYLKYTYGGEKTDNTYKIMKINLTDRCVETLDYNEILNKPAIPRMFNSDANIRAVGANSFMPGYIYDVNGDTDRMYTGFIKNKVSDNIVGTYIKRVGTVYETQKCNDTWNNTRDVLMDKYGNILLDEDTIQIVELGHDNYKLVWKEYVDDNKLTSIGTTGNKLKLSNPYSYKRQELKAALYNINSGYITNKVKSKNIFIHPKLPIALLIQEATGKVFMCILNQGDKGYIIDEPQNISKYFETQISSDNQTLRFNLDISRKNKIWVYTDVYLNPILVNTKEIEAKQYK